MIFLLVLQKHGNVQAGSIFFKVCFQREALRGEKTFCPAGDIKGFIFRVTTEP
jgi:hypothetical protein